MRHSLKVYAPALMLGLCALWVGLVDASRGSTIGWLLAIALAIVVQAREIRASRPHRRRRE